MKKILFTAFALLAFSLANADEFTISTVISNPSSVFDNLVVTGTQKIGLGEDVSVQIGAVDADGGDSIFQKQIVRTYKKMRFATDDEDSAAITVVAKDGTYVTGGILGAQEGIYAYSGGDVFINTGEQESVNIGLQADYLYASGAFFNTDFSVTSVRTINLKFFNSSGQEIALGAPYDIINNGSIYWHHPDSAATLASRTGTATVLTGWHKSTDGAIISGSAESNKRTSQSGTMTETLPYSVSRVRIEPFCQKTNSSDPNTACQPRFEISNEDGFTGDATASAISTLSDCNLSNKTLEQFAKENCAGNGDFKCYLPPVPSAPSTNFTCEKSKRTDSGLYCLYHRELPVSYTIFSCTGEPSLRSYDYETYYRDKLESVNMQLEPISNAGTTQNLRFVTFRLE